MKSLSEILEPAAVVLNDHPDAALEDVAALSTAISLKRIADLLDRLERGQVAARH